jgi:hypothetical protein
VTGGLIHPRCEDFQTGFKYFTTADHVAGLLRLGKKCEELIGFVSTAGFSADGRR